MNDKKFIEELKFKREEYGVSQKRLAVACGIAYGLLCLYENITRRCFNRATKYEAVQAHLLVLLWT